MYSRTYNSNQNNYDKQSIMAIILKNLPRECSLTKIEYEGPRIALYSNQPEFLLQNNHVLSNIVNLSLTFMAFLMFLKSQSNNSFTLIVLHST